MAQKIMILSFIVIVSCIVKAAAQSDCSTVKDQLKVCTGSCDQPSTNGDCNIEANKPSAANIPVTAVFKGECDSQESCAETCDHLSYKYSGCFAAAISKAFEKVDPICACVDELTDTEKASLKSFVEASTLVSKEK